MKVTARDIDHLSIATPDPEALAIKLQQIGFNLTPEGVEPRCICFQPAEDDIPNYVELIEADVRVAVAVNVAELEGEVREHSWETDDGYEVEAEMIVGEIDGPLPWFPVRHQMPEAFMEPEWIVHPNGALGMLAVHAVSDDPPATAKALGEQWGAITEDLFDGCTMVQTGAVEIMIWSPSAYQTEYKSVEAMAPEHRPMIVGIAVAVERSRPFRRCCAPTTCPSP